MVKNIKHILTSLFIISLGFLAIGLESCAPDVCAGNPNSQECRCKMYPTSKGCGDVPQPEKDVLQDKLKTYGRYFAYYVSKAILPLMRMDHLSIGINNVQNESGNPKVPNFTKGFFIDAANHMFSSNIAFKYIRIIDLTYNQSDGNRIRTIPNVDGSILYYIDAQISSMDKILDVNRELNLDVTLGKASSELTSGVLFSKNKKLTQYELSLQIKEFGTNGIAVADSSKVIVPSYSSSTGFSLYFMRQGFSFSYTTTIEPSKADILRYLAEYSLMTSFSTAFGTPYWHCLNKVEAPEDFKNYIHEMWLNKPEDALLLKKLIILNYVYYNNKERELLNNHRKFYINETILPSLSERETDRILIALCEAKGLPNCESVNKNFNVFWELYNGSPYCNYPLPKEKELVAIKNSIDKIIERRAKINAPRRIRIDKDTAHIIKLYFD